MWLFLWISLALLTCFGKCERNQEYIRHQRTRYLTLGSHFFTGNNSYPDDRQNFRQPRPLFSWDTPTNELSAAPPVNYRFNNSEIKPTVWHARKKPKPLFKRLKQANRLRPVSRTRVKPVSFRKSYVYKAIPSEEARPTQSKKIIYVVSRRGESGRKGHRCKNPRKCGKEIVGKWSKRRYHNQNEYGPSNDVEYFPKGLIAQGIDELRSSWNNRRNKHFKTGAERSGHDGSKSRTTSLCSTESCEQICTEQNGLALCSCYSGFRMNKESKCIDINECEVDNGGCDGTCVNTIGSRRCLCPDGFRLSPSDNRCLDINECLLRNGHGPCQDTCINKIGGYYCTCDGLKGTVLSRDNHTCEEVNACESGTAGCSHSCISTFGRSFCTCPDGYELGDDWRTCHDVDECSEFPDLCEFGCVNTVGSYYCEMENTLSG